MKYQDAVNQRRRLCVLFALWLAPAYRAPLRGCRDVLASAYGIDAPLHRIEADASWLQETGLLRVDGPIAQLTDLGLDVVLGRVQAPGVRRPDPDELAELAGRP